MKKLPAKIMIGEMITYMLVILLVFSRNDQGEYLVKKRRREARHPHPWQQLVPRS